MPTGTEIEFLGFPRALIGGGARETVSIAPLSPIRITGLAVNRACSPWFLIHRLRVGLVDVIFTTVGACAYEAPGKALPDSGLVFPSQQIVIEVENISGYGAVFSAWIAYWAVPGLEPRFPDPRFIAPSRDMPRDPGPPPALGRALPSRKFSFDEE